MAERVSLAQARRIALAAQGFAEPRPTGRVDRRHLRRILERMGLIQIDSVNVLVRSQELPLFARLGPHPRTLIAEHTAAGELYEHWVHEASHVPTQHHHLHRYRTERALRPGGRFADLAARRPELIEDVFRRVADEGPLTAGAVSERAGPKGTWWDWDDGKLALEYLFLTGRLAATRRSSDFARLYDLTERVIPAAALQRPAPAEREARKELLVMAAGHHGIGTLDDLADYHRQPLTTCRPLVAELVGEGRLEQVQVEGWTRPAYVTPGVRVPRRVSARALLSPFDPLVWHRPRTERLFGFHYRIEIYTPRPQRRFGYYVLPFLLGERLVARVDLKADRARGALMVPGAFAEEGTDPGETAAELAEELRSMAAWLGLRSIEVGDRGDLAAHLDHALHDV